MPEKMSLAEQIQNCILLNYGGAIDNQFMKTINMIADDVAKLEAYNSELVEVITDLMDYIDMTESVHKDDYVYQNLINVIQK